jgi:quinol-cytochrome oxidoreductase complex cytochrome b subunit
MNIKIFNVALLIGWLMVLAGGVVINPGWGVALSGALLLVLTMASAYIAGLQPAPKPDDQGGQG